uniref:Uncharacterized protein n=1 Tax=Romanomermis culicivorax TaxID=13658 RepID=A0A915I2P3_ROMCU
MFSRTLLRAVIFLFNNQKIIDGMVSTPCCPNSYHPTSKIWINVSSALSSVIDYTFYDITREIRKIWAYEVDHSAAILKDDKIFEAPNHSILEFGMCFNIGLKSNYSTRSILNMTVQSNQKNAVIEKPG